MGGLGDNDDSGLWGLVVCGASFREILTVLSGDVVVFCVLVSFRHGNQTSYSGMGQL